MHRDLPALLIRRMSRKQLPLFFCHTHLQTFKSGLILGKMPSTKLSNFPVISSLSGEPAPGCELLNPAAEGFLNPSQPQYTEHRSTPCFLFLNSSLIHGVGCCVTGPFPGIHRWWRTICLASLPVSRNIKTTLPFPPRDEERQEISQGEVS